jgi:uncharacterized protein (TIRG00374 family)
LRGADRNWIRLLGVGLLMLLLWKLDTGRTFALLRHVAPLLLAAAIILNVPQILLKAVRWRELLRCHGIRYPVGAAALSYFGSIFIGLLTPGRLGEFVKAFHVNHDCDVQVGRAFSSVLVDRLFDLYALLLFGGSALLSTAHTQGSLMALAYTALILTLPVFALLHDRVFAALEGLGRRLGSMGRRLFAPQSWLMELRTYMRELPASAIVSAAVLTIFAYAIFFGQCYLLVLALRMKITFLQTCFAVSLGSLVTLIPVSISGLGTREAAVVAYLGTAGVAAEAALGYSLLVFLTFYVAGGLIGAVAWLIKPVSLARIREMRRER